MKNLTNNVYYKLIKYCYDMYFVFCINPFVKNIETDVGCLSAIEQILIMENTIK